MSEWVDCGTGTGTGIEQTASTHFKLEYLPAPVEASGGSECGYRICDANFPI